MPLSFDASIEQQVPCRMPYKDCVEGESSDVAKAPTSVVMTMDP